MTHGMICAPQPEAVEAGALALKKGGNAVDAAIACALMQTVVDPQMCGIAGFGSLQLYLPKRGIHTMIDFHGRAPAKATPDMWRDILEFESEDGFGFILKGRVNDLGYQSVTTPGSLKAFHEALTRFGTLSWKEVVEPAAALAGEGFLIRPHVHEFWTMKESFGRTDHIERLRHTPAGRRIYFDSNGEVLQPGATLRNPDMARSLRRIAAEGPEVFYQGAMAREIAHDFAANGGLLGLEDLKNVATEESEPLLGNYRGYGIATNPPPGGGIMILQMLNILENFDLAAMGHNSPDYIRVVSEAMKRATIDKDAHVGDPRFVEVPLARLIGKDYAREQAQAIERGEVAHVPRLQKGQDLKDTTHISAVDDQGNAVAMTHSLGMSSGAITDGLGFMYNNSMVVFDPRPGQHGSIAPGKARFTAMCPTMVFKDDTLRLVVGAPGGTFITMGVLQAILNVIDFAMSASDAVAAPRFCTTSDTIDVVNRIPHFVTDELEAQGYAVRRSYKSFNFAGVHAVEVRDGKWHGGADPGRDGMALEV